MRRLCAGLQTFLLLAVALALAAHPLLRSFSLPHFAASPFAESQIIICTAHGSVVIDEPLGVPGPAKESPSCPWCAVAGGAAGKLAAVSPTEVGLLVPPELLQHRFERAQWNLPHGLADWPAHAPRGPPRAVTA
jgi:hypothetical protein